MQDWDVSRVTSMRKALGYEKRGLECDIPDISGWDVSQVTDFVSISLAYINLV